MKEKSKKKACEQVLYCRDRIGVDIPTTRTNARLVSFLKDMLSEQRPQHTHTQGGGSSRAGQQKRGAPLQCPIARSFGNSDNLIQDLYPVGLLVD
jgi:hypothetical protein